MKILVAMFDPEADAIYIQLLEGKIATTKELDSNRLIDYSEDGRATGVDLMEVSQGVKLDGLPEAELIGKILAYFDIRARQSKDPQP